MCTVGHNEGLSLRKRTSCMAFSSRAVPCRAVSDGAGWTLEKIQEAG